MQRKVISSFKKEGTTNAGKAYIKFDVKFEGDQTTYTGFGEENRVEVGQVVDVETWSKQNGAYTNHSYKVTQAPAQNYTANTSPAANNASTQNTDELLEILRQVRNVMALKAAQDGLTSQGKPGHLDNALPDYQRILQIIKG